MECVGGDRPLVKEWDTSCVTESDSGSMGSNRASLSTATRVPVPRGGVRRSPSGHRTPGPEEMALAEGPEIWRSGGGGGGSLIR